MTTEEIPIIVDIRYRGKLCDRKCRWLDRSRCILFAKPLRLLPKDTYPIEFMRCHDCINHKNLIPKVISVLKMLRQKEKAKNKSLEKAIPTTSRMVVIPGENDGKEENKFDDTEDAAAGSNERSNDEGRETGGEEEQEGKEKDEKKSNVKENWKDGSIEFNI